MYAEANDCQGILILLIRFGRLRRATTKHRIHLFSLSRTDPHRCNEPPVNLFASENEQREQRARTFNESEDRKFSGKCLILNEDREVGEWRKSIRVLFQRFFLCKWTGNCNDLESGTRRKYESSFRGLKFSKENANTNRFNNSSKILNIVWSIQISRYLHCY